MYKAIPQTTRRLQAASSERYLTLPNLNTISRPSLDQVTP